jgi:hypothetical protein
MKSHLISYLLPIVVCISNFAPPVSAQHSLQGDDGANHYFLITGTGLSSPLTTFTLPPGGGQLLTSGTAWLLGGNSSVNAATNFLGSINNADLVFKTNNNEQMRIAITGNLGIGTAPNTYRLNMAGIASTGAGIYIDMNTIPVTPLGAGLYYGNISGVSGTNVYGGNFQVTSTNAGATGINLVTTVGGSANANGVLANTSSNGGGVAFGVNGIASQTGAATGQAVGGNFFGTGANSSAFAYGIQSGAKSLGSGPAIAGSFVASGSSSVNEALNVATTAATGTNIAIVLNSTGSGSTGIKFATAPETGIDMTATQTGIVVTGKSSTTGGMFIDMTTNPVADGSSGINVRLTGQPSSVVNGISSYTKADLPFFTTGSAFNGGMQHTGLGTGSGIQTTVYSNAQAGAESIGGYFTAYGNIGGCDADLYGSISAANAAYGTTGSLYGAFVSSFGGSANSTVTGVVVSAISGNASPAIGVSVNTYGSTTSNTSVSITASGTGAVALDITKGPLRSSATVGNRFADTKTLNGGAATEAITNSLATTTSTIVLTFQGTAFRANALGSLIITALANGSFTVGNAAGVNFQNSDVVHYIIINH